MIAPEPNSKSAAGARSSKTASSTARKWRFLGLWQCIGAGGVALVIVLSLGPPAALPPAATFSDKWGHCLAYATLMGWYAQILGPSRFKAAALLLALLGIGLEGLQALHPEREPDLWDIVANGVGLGLGAILGRRVCPDLLARVDAWLAR